MHTAASTASLCGKVCVCALGSPDRTFFTFSLSFSPSPALQLKRIGCVSFCRQVDLSIEPGQSLGLMIRGGIEYNLGVFITGVDKDSVADRAGLMVNPIPLFILIAFQTHARIKKRRIFFFNNPLLALCATVRRCVASVGRRRRASRGVAALPTAWTQRR